MFDSNVNKIFLGTDGAASSTVGQILPLRVEVSIPYSAPLNVTRSSTRCDVKLCRNIRNIFLQFLTSTYHIIYGYM